MVYLSVYNASQKECQTTISIDANALGLRAKNTSLKDLLSDKTWAVAARDGTARLQLVVSPHTAGVLAPIAKGK